MSLAFLVQMGWKSALIAGGALVILRLLRSRSAADRAAVLQLAMALLLLLPVLAVAVPSLQVAPPLPAASVPAVSAWAAPEIPAPVAVGPLAAMPPPAPSLSLGETLALAYAAGVALLALRMGAGLLTLARWTRRAAPITAPEWTAALARARAAAGIGRRVRLLASDHVPSPLSWGLVQPTILIDRASLARSQDIDAILAHETAHVARRDWLILVLSHLAVALFWFNPLVWRLERALVQAAEEAADRRAIERVEPLAYASTLVACVREAGRTSWAVPANGIAPRRSLKARVDAILDQEQRSRASGSLFTAAAMALCVALAGPVAALELVSEAPTPRPSARPATIVQSLPLPPLVPAAAPATAPGALAAPSRPLPSAAATPAREAFAPAPAAPALAAAEDQNEDSNDDHNDDHDEDRAGRSVAEVRVPEIRIPEIRIPEIRVPEVRVREIRIPAINVRIPDVGPIVSSAMIRAHARSGARAGRALSAESIFNITDADKRAYAEAGYPNLSRDRLIELTLNRVTPQYIREMADAGYPGLTTDQLVELRIFGVNAAFVRRAAARGEKPTPDDLVEMRLFGRL